MIFVCNKCHTILPHFRALLEHYKDFHPEVLKRYRIKNKRLKQTLIMEGESAEQLCEVNYWDIKDCKVEEVS